MRKLSNIQILRALAAFMVVVSHCGLEMKRIGEVTGDKLFFDNEALGTGVVLFFAISGFIMVATSYDGFARPGASLDFARRRIIRIVPLYWAITACAVVGALLAPQMISVPVTEPGYILSSFLFWPDARVNGLVRPITTPGWTLNLEMMFYTVFTFALLFPRRVGLAVALSLLGGLTLAQILGVFSHGPLASVQLNFWGDPIIVGFMLGMVVGVAYKMGYRLSYWPALIIGAIGLALLVHPSIPGYPEDNIIIRAADFIPAFIVLIAVALGPQVDGARQPWVLPMLIGDASYSLYLSHEFFIRPLRVLWVNKLASFMPYWSFLVIGIIVALSVGFLSYFLFERPVTRWLTRGDKRKPVSVDQRPQRLVGPASAA
ncbi:MAG TPA: acyltransferase [Xanthobacteraceae bacterium]|jgi:exopolysaccharide production protein ExoZ|nr:acyltransferase [Xanthobacteraceae bacterium]